MPLPPFTPKSDWKAPVVSKLPAWPKHGRVCVDLETRDPQLTTLGPGWRRDAKIVGAGFAIEDGPAAYLPVAHANGTNLNPQHVFDYLRDNARDFEGDIVGANLPYDLDGLANEGIVYSKASFRDVCVAEPLLDELQFSYGLDAIALRRALAGKDEELLNAAAQAWGVHPKKGLHELPPEFVGPYGEQDCRSPLAILRRQEKEIDEQGLWDVWNLESKLLPVLLKMRRRGVRLDFDKLDQIEEWAKMREISALARITHQTGIQLTTSDTTKTAALVPVLAHTGINFDLPKHRTAPTEKFPMGQPSIKNDWLETLPQNDIVDAVLEAKKFNKLSGTFVKSIRNHATNGRIHCTFKQMIGESEGGESEGARYGRLSCKDPNLQQQPARDKEIGPMWRQIYIPEEGGQWACLDYSQQEPRWTTHFAELLKLPKASEMAEKYRTDPNADNHDMVATMINPNWPNLDKEAADGERKYAKVINLGLSYGMGEYRLCLSLGKPTKMKSFINREGERIEYMGAGDEAQAILDRYQKAVPFIKKLMQKVADKAGRRGWVRTVDGRKCRFPRLSKPKKVRGAVHNYDWTFKAGNRLIQGSAGGQMKTAMVLMDESGVDIQLQVHDEVDLTIYSPDTALQCAEIMRNAVPCNVPHKVDIEVGPNWGEIKEPEWAK